MFQFKVEANFWTEIEENMLRDIEPLEKGTLGGYVVRQIRAGVEKVLRYIRTHEWVSREEHMLNRLNYYKILMKKEGDNFLDYTRIKAMRKVCDYLLRRASEEPAKITKSDVEKLKADLNELKKKEELNYDKLRRPALNELKEKAELNCYDELHRLLYDIEQIQMQLNATGYRGEYIDPKSNIEQIQGQLDALKKRIY